MVLSTALAGGVAGCTRTHSGGGNSETGATTVSGDGISTTGSGGSTGSSRSSGSTNASAGGTPDGATSNGSDAGGSIGGEGGMAGDTGFTGDAGGTGGTGGTGVDDPCSPNPCEHGRCELEESSYVCECEAGYTGDNCETNIDDCDPDPCVNGACIDRVDDYECDCGESGYTGANCETLIQNCAQTPCDNDGVCTDVGSSRICDCTGTGATGASCEVDIDECASEPCEHGTCTNGTNEYTCNCADTGFQGANCQTDINECATDNGGCDPLTSCTNIPGSRTCGACPSGYSGNGESGCRDINECASNNGGCDPLTSCTNTAGSRTCGACPAGYSGNGASGCSDINECASNNGGCDPLTTCTNIPGGRSCGPCPAGYSGTGATGCTNINECSPNPCRNGGSCQDGVGSFTCSCAAPWSGSICGNATLTVDATSRGYYTNLDWYPPSSAGVVRAGTCEGCGGVLFRSFFVFPIPNFTGTIDTVTLRLEHVSYDSVQPSESVGAWDVTTNLTNLIAGSGSGTEWIQAWTDLGSGTQYGSFSVSDSTEGTLRSATLNGSAISKVSSSRGASVGIGISLESYSGQTLVTEWGTFAIDSEARTHQLQIVVVP